MAVAGVFPHLADVALRVVGTADLRPQHGTRAGAQVLSVTVTPKTVLTLRAPAVVGNGWRAHRICAGRRASLPGRKGRQ